MGFAFETCLDYRRKSCAVFIAGVRKYVDDIGFGQVYVRYADQRKCGFVVGNLYAFRRHGFIVGDFNFDHNGQSASRFDVLFNGVDVANNYPFGLYFSN